MPLWMWRVPRWPGSTDAAAPPALILLYHAVLDTRSDPWGLRVRLRNFAEHMAVLRAHCFPTSLIDLHAGLDTGNIPHRAVVVTFDDGYLNNLSHALPAMQRRQVPGTIFVASGYVGARQEYWWDEIDRLILHSRHLPPIVRLDVGDASHRWELGAAARFDAYRRWRTRGWFAWQAPPTLRHRLFIEVWKALHDAPSVEAREAALQQLRMQAGADADGRPTHRCCTSDQLRQLARDPLIEIGAHTVSHPSLGHISVPEQRREIFDSKSTLENILQQTITSFSYPFGTRADYSSDTISLLREAGFARSCSNFPEPLTANVDRYQLPRRVVMDWTGAQLAARLAKWFVEK
jgi:peptidoglycan/xylan/chitin deacetylase (PgdA/CDA1 family)